MKLEAYQKIESLRAEYRWEGPPRLRIAAGECGLAGLPVALARARERRERSADCCYI